MTLQKVLARVVNTLAHATGPAVIVSSLTALSGCREAPKDQGPLHPPVDNPDPSPKPIDQCAPPDQSFTLVVYANGMSKVSPKLGADGKPVLSNGKPVIEVGSPQDAVSVIHVDRANAANVNTDYPGVTYLARGLWSNSAYPALQEDDPKVYVAQGLEKDRQDGVHWAAQFVGAGYEWSWGHDVLDPLGYSSLAKGAGTVWDLYITFDKVTCAIELRPVQAVLEGDTVEKANVGQLLTIPFYAPKALANLPSYAESVGDGSIRTAVVCDNALQGNGVPLCTGPLDKDVGSAQMSRITLYLITGDIAPNWVGFSAGDNLIYGADPLMRDETLATFGLNWFYGANIPPVSGLPYPHAFAKFDAPAQTP